MQAALAAAEAPTEEREAATMFLEEWEDEGASLEVELREIAALQDQGARSEGLARRGRG